MSPQPEFRCREKSGFNRCPEVRSGSDLQKFLFKHSWNSSLEPPHVTSLGQDVE